ncbi:wall-associated receptor kinase 3-like [Panicum virgatum]|uniref:wall-associated receptor kinase 3-like n=1 Tax=Panicum virgatum TaxID=38727 RepID=UPI0019D645F5|nr:wall-associated receptor kinase 3-like [Panicum virgatum]
MWRHGRAIPFGISNGCSLPGFGLTCDSTHNPPRLLLGDDGGSSNLQVVRISIQEANIRVKYTTANITWDDSIPPSSGQYLLSGDLTQFLVTEPNDADVRGAALMPGNASNIISGSCTSFWHVKYNVTIQFWVPNDGGRHRHPSIGGTCHRSPANIPIARSSYTVGLRWLYPNHVYRIEAQQASSSDQWIERRRWALITLNKTQLDGNATCPKDLGSTFCHSRYSFCKTISHLTYPTRIRTCCPGYTCQCWDGYQGNPYLPNGCQDVDECKLPNKCYGHCTNIPGGYICRCPRGTHGLSIVSALGSGAMLLILVVGTMYLKRKIKMQRLERMKLKFFEQNRGQLLQLLVSERADIAEGMIITLNELQQATNNFDKALRLGGGGHGSVYKGILLSQDVVAIKRSNIVIQREIDEFINEVAILSQVKHRNIVKLLGCCLETEVPLLVYEFISNGTLYAHLHVRDPISLSWNDRLRIAVETSKALAYLHSLVSRPIIHRDIKSTNILHDDNLTVKLSDFGASRYMTVNQMGVNTIVQGTRGHSLVQHFDILLSEGRLDYILDRQVINEAGGEVTDVALLAAICVQLSAEDRPTMRVLEMALEAIQAAKEPVSSTMTDDSFDWTSTWVHDMSNEG